MGAWNSLLRWTCYVAFFLLLYWAASRDKKIHQLLPVVFQITGIWIAIHMLFNQFGWLEYPTAFIFDRFAGVFQYPNTFGMIMGVFYLFSLMMLLQSRNNLPTFILYAAPLVIFMICFIESYSRGMFLVLPVTWFVGLLLLRPLKQIQYVLYTFISVVAGVMGTVILKQDTPVANLIYITIISGIVVLLLIFIKKWISNPKFDKFGDNRLYRFIGPAVMMVFALLLLLDLGFKGLVYQQMPTDLQERISSMTGSTSARERVLFTQDAFEMTKESPLFGSGGDSWASLYRTYQQLPYQANKAHNEYLEFAIDIGWLGLAGMIAVFGFFYFIIVKKYRHSDENTAFIAVMISSLTILLHSLIDFNLSFGTVWLLLLWLLVYGLLGEENLGAGKLIDTKFYKYGIYAFFGLLLVVGFFSYRFMTAEHDYRLAINTNNISEKEFHLNEAVDKNPYSHRYLFASGNLYIQLVNRDINVEANSQNVIGIAGKLTELEPNNSFLLYQAGLMLEDVGETAMASSLFEKALDLDDFGTDIYEAAIRVKLELDREQTDPSAKGNHLNDAIAVYEQLVITYADFEKNPIGNEHNSRKFQVSDDAKSMAAEVYYMLADTVAIETILMGLESDSDVVEDVVVLLVLSLQEAGKFEEAADVLEAYQAVYPDLAERFME